MFSTLFSAAQSVALTVTYVAVGTTASLAFKALSTIMPIDTNTQAITAFALDTSAHGRSVSTQSVSSAASFSSGSSTLYPSPSDSDTTTDSDATSDSEDETSAPINDSIGAWVEGAYKHIPLPASPALSTIARFSDEELVSSVQNGNSSSSDSDSDGLKTPPATDLELVAVDAKEVGVVVVAQEGTVGVTEEESPILHAPVIAQVAHVEATHHTDDTVSAAIALQAETIATVALAASIPLPRSRNNIRKPKVKAVIVQEPVVALVAASAKNKNSKRKDRNKKNKQKVKPESVPSLELTSKPKLAFRVDDKAVDHPIYHSEDLDVVAAAFLAGPPPPDVGVWPTEDVQIILSIPITAAVVAPIVNLPRKRHTPPVARSYANALAHKVNASLQCHLPASARGRVTSSYAASKTILIGSVPISVAPRPNHTRPRSTSLPSSFITITAKVGQPIPTRLAHISLAAKHISPNAFSAYIDIDLSLLFPPPTSLPSPNPLLLAASIEDLDDSYAYYYPPPATPSSFRGFRLAVVEGRIGGERALLRGEGQMVEFKAFGNGSRRVWEGRGRSSGLRWECCVA